MEKRIENKVRPSDYCIISAADIVVVKDGEAFILYVRLCLTVLHILVNDCLQCGLDGGVQGFLLLSDGRDFLQFCLEENAIVLLG